MARSAEGLSISSSASGPGSATATASIWRSGTSWCATSLNAVPGVDRRLLTSSAIDVIDDGCDIVVELIGGVHTAGAFIRRALGNGKDVVTANKALLAAHGDELFEIAAARGLSIGFEASVCGGIPVVRVLHRGLAGDSIESIRGIVNGTCNFVLSRMEEGLDFDAAVRAAQERGFAEADPSLDIDGYDSAQKLRILSSLAFDAPITHESVIGIRSVTRAEIERAHAGGCVIRLVAEAERVPGGVTLRVRPQEIDASDIFGTIRDEFNVVAIRGRATGEVILTGKGAGAQPTASAVLADVIEIAQLRRGRGVEGLDEVRPIARPVAVRVAAVS